MLFSFSHLLFLLFLPILVLISITVALYLVGISIILLFSNLIVKSHIYYNIEENFKHINNTIPPPPPSLCAVVLWSNRDNIHDCIWSKRGYRVLKGDKKKNYAPKCKRASQFEIGDLVLLKVSSKEMGHTIGKNGMLALSYICPFEIRIGCIVLNVCPIFRSSRAWWFSCFDAPKVQTRS